MRKFYALPLTAIFFVFCAYAQPSVSYQSFITGLSAPVEIANPGDGSNRLFIVQQSGTVRVYDPANGGLQATPFLDITSLVTFAGDERGFLSLAFHPDYKNNGYFFVYYNNKTGNGDVTIARYKVSANRNIADPASGVVLFSITKPFTNHNGGHLQFRKDGAVYNLYFAAGDGGSGNDPNNNAQTGTSLLGKMIRINVDNFTVAPYYTAPTSNPFYGNASYDNRVWALGLRNPFRWSFDRLTGDLWIGDVGQVSKEEIDYRPASSTGGENYGWRCYEGSIPNPNIPPCNPAPSNYFPPIFDYDNPNGGNSPSTSVIGGRVYRGSQYPTLYGYYFATDYYSGTLYLIKPNGGGGWTVSQQTGLQNFVAAFGEDENGVLYAASQATGTVYRVIPTTALPVSLISFTAQRSAGSNELRWTTATEQSNTKFVVEYSQDGTLFTKAGEVSGNGNANGSNYLFVHAVNSNVPLFYRLAMIETNDNLRYSSIVKINAKENAIKIYPTLISDGRFFIDSKDAIEKVQVVNSNGSIVFEKKFTDFNGPERIQLPVLARGIYVARITGAGSSNHKIMIE